MSSLCTARVPATDLLRIWDVGAGKETGSLPVGDDDAELEEFHGTGLAVSDVNGTIALWDVRTLAKLWSTQVSGPAGAFTDVHFSSDGRLVTNVVFSQNPAGVNAADGRLLSSADTGYRGGPVLPAGTAYASMVGGRFVDLRTGKPVGAGFGPANAIEFSRSGTRRPPGGSGCGRWTGRPG
ncbi:hypothetical protein [Nonomuraea sp. JJY05]|uniref:hypothetical protein n=1 Tax=Nonomuraea sp. JJY05 TaxID=3350255 RepID=UPI00373F9B5F